jgi:dipeptidyl aminopeptidase/acylaminoacyl peptidase
MSLCNVTADYPPTFLIHGTEDTDVPFDESKMMAEALEAAGVEHEMHPIEGAEHGLKDGAPEAVNAAFDSAFAFLAKHLQS